MGLRLQISAKEVKAEKLVKPGWYAVLVEKVVAEINKKKDADNYVVDVVGKEGDSDGVPIKCFFSEKFIQSINAFVRATGPLQGIPKPLSEETGLDPDYDLEKTIGNIIYAQIVTNKGQDGQQKGRNSIEDWAPLPKNHPLNTVSSTTEAVGVGGFTT